LDLTCVDFNDNSCGLQSSVAWTSVEGRLYFILVHGSSTQEAGDYVLDVGSNIPTPAPTTVSSTNDLCDNAFELVTGIQVSSTTRGATFDDIPATCGRSSSPGRWYKWIGNGGGVSIGTCVDASFDTYISVFEGPCSDLSCVGHNDDSCGFQSSVSWASVAGREYLILVHGFGSEAGDFVLEATVNDDLPTASPTNSPAINDECESASILEIGGDAIIGESMNARQDDVGGICGVGSAPGLWYKVRGDGGQLTVSTCFGADYDTYISVFEGSCSDLSCIGHNDDTCGFSSSVTWESKRRTEYLVLVHGYNGTSGGFGLEVTTDRGFCGKPEEFTPFREWFCSVFFGIFVD